MEERQWVFSRPSSEDALCCGRVGLQHELQSSSDAVKQAIASTAGFERLQVTRFSIAWREASSGKVLEVAGRGNWSKMWRVCKRAQWWHWGCGAASSRGVGRGSCTRGGRCLRWRLHGDVKGHRVFTSRTGLVRGRIVLVAYALLLRRRLVFARRRRRRCGRRR